MNSFLESLVKLEPASYAFTFSDIILVLALSTLLGLIVSKVYTITHSGISYSRTFVLNLVIMTCVVSCIMLIVGSNIARAFTLVGALSVVRFRNAIKDTIDVGFIFFAMSVGMACGTRFFSMAIIMTVFISTLIILLTKMKYGERNSIPSLFKIVINSDGDQSEIGNIIRPFSHSYQLANINALGSGELELNYSVFVKNFNQDPKIIEKMKSNPSVKDIQIFRGDALAEI